MKASLIDTSWFAAEALAVYPGDNVVTTVAHEIAHQILLFGRARRDDAGDVEARCDRMPVHVANRHEVKTVALQLAGLRALGYHQSLRRAVEISFDGLRGHRRRRKTLKTKVALARVIEAERPSRRNVRKFVRAYRTLSRFA